MDNPTPSESVKSLNDPQVVTCPCGLTKFWNTTANTEGVAMFGCPVCLGIKMIEPRGDAHDAE